VKCYDVDVFVTVGDEIEMTNQTEELFADLPERGWRGDLWSVAT